MSNIINTRSPYYERFSRENALSVKLNITIYTGVQGDAPATANYTLTKNTDEPTGAPYEQAVFEISELIRDFIYTEYYQEAVDVVWVKLEHTYYDGLNATGNVLSGGGVNYYLAVDGFGYFEEGINPRKTIDPTAVSFTPMLLQDNITVYFIKGEEIKLPIWAETEPLIDFTFSGGAAVEWQTLDDFWDTYEATWNSSLDDVQIDDNGNTNQKIQYVGIFPTDGIETGDTAVITSTVGTAQSITVTFKELCELKYTPVRVIFYNKYGALQDIWASKKSIKNLNQTADTYKSNIIDLGTLSYSTYKHVQKRFDVQGQETISVSTAYLDESVNEPVKQLLMSEQVWLEIGTETYPVVLKTSSIQEKTSVNDKLVAYTFEFDYASGKIQNVR
jgi:hypothetical protein